MPEEEALCAGCGMMQGLWFCEVCDEFYFEDVDTCEKCGKVADIPKRPETDRDISSPEILSP